MSQSHARDLVECTALADATTTVREILEWFRGQPGFDYISVEQDGAIVGLVGRDQLNAQLAGQYGFATLAEKPVTRVMIPDPLAIDGGRTLAEVAREIIDANRAGGEFYRDLVVHENGQYLGLASVRRLLIEQLGQNQEQMARLERQTEALARKNRELFEASLQADKSAHEFKDFFQTCSIPLVVLNVDGAIEQANPRFLKLFGETPEALRERSSRDDLFVGGYEALHADYTRLRENYGGFKPTLQARMRKRDATEIGVEFSLETTGEGARAVVSILRIATAEELVVQQHLASQLEGKGELARSLVRNLINHDTTSNTQAMWQRLINLVDSAEKLERVEDGRGAVDSAPGTPGNGAVGEEKGTFSGDLSTFGCVDLLQLLVQGQKTGELQINVAEAGRGYVYFRRGRIVHALFGSLTAEEALRGLIRVNAGTFAFLFDSICLHESIRASRW